MLPILSPDPTVFVSPGAYLRKVLSTGPLCFWPLTERSGTVIADIAGNAGNIITAAGFEWQASLSLYGNWSAQVNGGTWASETTITHSGTSSVKITADATGTSYGTRVVHDYFTVTPEMTYGLSFWSYGDGTNAGRYKVNVQPGGTDIISLRTTGITAAAWGQVSTSFTTPAGCTGIRFSLYCAPVNGAVVYFDDQAIIAPVATEPYNGVLAGSGVTFGVAGPGDGQPAIRLNGTSYIDIYTGALENAINYQEGSVLIWWRYKSLADCAGGEGTQQSVFSVLQESVSGVRDNILLEKDVEDGNLYHSSYYSAYGQAGDTQHVESINPYSLTWHCTVMTWSVSNARMIIYLDGAYPTTMLPPYDADPDGIETAARGYLTEVAQIGAFLGNRKWKGDLARCALWTRELSASEVASLSRI
jgi:hypothetical protein